MEAEKGWREKGDGSVQLGAMLRIHGTHPCVEVEELKASTEGVDRSPLSAGKQSTAHPS